MDLQSGYKISETATSYAALCGVLAGFAFVAITLIISGQLVDQERVSDDEKVIVQRLAEVLVLAFFTLIGSTVLQTIRSGVPNNLGVSDKPDDKYNLVIALSLTVVVDFQMIIAILTLFTAFFIMVNNFLWLNHKSKRRMARMFDITALVALLFNYMTNINLWQVLTNLGAYRMGIVLLWEFTAPIIAYFLVKKTRASMQEVFALVVSGTVVACCLATFIWSSSPQLLQPLYNDPRVLYVISFGKSVVLAIVAGWLHQLSGPQKLRVTSSTASRG